MQFVCCVELRFLALRHEGIGSFAHLIKKRNIVVWSDNTGAEAATRNATARAFDHLSIVHAIWLRAAELGISLFVKRVPTKENIADDPSRERRVGFPSGGGCPRFVLSE